MEYDEETEEYDKCDADTQLSAGSSSDLETESTPDPGIIHSVVFKCIGANKDTVSQQALRRAHDLLSQNKTVCVELKPEPHNPKDSHAIAFVCYLDGKPYRIGYVVREVLADVHDALTTNSILNITLEWIKFITSWSISGPGWFAGIKITKNGQWSDAVVKSASTKPF